MTDRNDTSPLIDVLDVPAALGLLSRLPVRVDTNRATARGARAAWAYPFAGLVLGGIAAIVAQGAVLVGLSSMLAAGLALVSLTIMTGAMHEDGLADAADGLWGGWDKDRRLEIMKDSRIGVYGVCALIASLGLRWAALAALIEAGSLWGGIVGAAMLSRAMMVPVMARLPHARETGLSHSVGQPSVTTSWIAEGLGAIGCIALLGWAGLWAVVAALGAATACALIAKAKIGGQTGDILGATQQITSLSILITLAAVV